MFLVAEKKHINMRENILLTNLLPIFECVVGNEVPKTFTDKFFVFQRKLLYHLFLDL